MAVQDPNSVTTKLLTLLNVSATKVGKRKQPIDDVLAQPSEKLNKRRAISFDDGPRSPETPEQADDEGVQERVDEEEERVQEADEKSSGASIPTCMSTPSDTVADTVDDPYEVHFGAKTTLATESARNAVEQKTWATYRDKHGRLGAIITSFPDVDGATKPLTSNEVAVSAHVEHSLIRPHASASTRFWIR